MSSVESSPKHSHKSRIRRLLAGILAAVFLVCAYFTIRYIVDNRRSRELYADAVEQFVLKAEPNREPLPEASPGESPVPETPKRMFPTLIIDFEALMSVNDDILGWVWVPGTSISYPVVQGRSNYSYLSRDYTGRSANAGSIFLDSRNARDLSDPNSILYGHNMRSGSMFGSLKQFKEQEFVDTHSVFCILTPEHQFNYEIFAVETVDLYGDEYYTTFNREGSFGSYVETVLSNSLIETDVAVSEGDRICTLSTCTGDYWRERLIVVGRLWED